MSNHDHDQIGDHDEGDDDIHDQDDDDDDESNGDWNEILSQYQSLWVYNVSRE